MVTRLRPATLAELRDAVRDGPARLLIAGAGTASEWGGTPVTHDAVLDITGLNGILAYEPSDLTVTVRAGTPLVALQEVLVARRQQVALDAARISCGATVGGLLATADAGPARHTYGTLRDCVIGITVVLADGTVARSGGQVIKNVAGYDLAKLFHGSLGTLGVIAEVTLRLHPLAEASRTVAAVCTPEQSFELAGRLIREGLEPVATQWYDGRLLARFDGASAGVARRARATGFEAADPSVWREVADTVLGEPGDTVFRMGTLPSLWPWVAERVGALTDTAPALTSAVGAGIHTARLRAGDPEKFTRLREDLAERGGSTVVMRRGIDVPAWGPPPASVALMRAVKQRFDPSDRFGSGRFTPWF
ncbi:FAD-binding protein [Streptomyces scabiei]|uniref:FAD-binding oxidoreductase n=1 Tax=Streptomyces scabiei TaxID=1930 RepID=UPI0029904E4D|nr:FAD-binding protein [Streptomyces scabiei]MDW8803393.1 FAD-binding protein [Streptomyces scabiei]